MAYQLNPYLSFKDNARQAMEFYQGVFGGKLEVNTFGDYGDPNAPEADRVMHASLSHDVSDPGITLMGADTPPGGEYDAGGNITCSLSGDDADVLRGWWGKLSGGGSVSVPLEKQMWGDEFGMCTDQFGIAWMVNIMGAPPA
jgi:PhnB protein